MLISRYPNKNKWAELTKRPVMDLSGLQDKVKAILEDVRSNGDTAVKKYTQQFDNANLEQNKVSKKEFSEAEKKCDKKLLNAITVAYNNIYKFHTAQKEPVKKITTSKDVVCWRKSVGIEKVGLYIPGGTAPLFSTVLMLGIPAKIAGCKEIILCTPPGPDGKINPAILAAAKKAGIETVYKCGGVQAIAAMAYGTETILKVDKIFGPGNQYVTCAKQLVSQQNVAIDMPAGPSEVAVIADETCFPEFVAADLLAQLEHGTDSQFLLVVTSPKLLNDITKKLQEQWIKLPRKNIIDKSILNSRIVLLKNIDTCIDFINMYAPEHLIISCKNDGKFAEKIINAGSVFLGNYTPESAGDYASGTNHTLPTNGYAKAYSGVSLDSFVKKITFQKITKQGLSKLGPTIETMAAAEGLEAHKNAVTIRTK